MVISTAKRTSCSQGNTWSSETKRQWGIVARWTREIDAHLQVSQRKNSKIKDNLTSYVNLVQQKRNQEWPKTNPCRSKFRFFEWIGLSEKQLTSFGALMKCTKVVPARQNIQRRWRGFWFASECQWLNTFKIMVSHETERFHSLKWLQRKTHQREMKTWLIVKLKWKTQKSGEVEETYKTWTNNSHKGSFR